MAFSHIAALPLIALAMVVVPAAAGCASSGGPSSPRVMLVQDEEFTLTGTIDEKPGARGVCQAGSPKHLIKLIEPLKAKITLRGTNGAAPLMGAIMSVTNMESKKTICAEMKADGQPAVLPAEFPIGTYAIAVAGDEPRRYEIVWEQR